MTMLLPFVVSLILILLFCLSIKKQHVELVIDVHYELDTKRTALYALLFAVSILSVFNIIPYLASFGIVIVFMLVLDKKAFYQDKHTPNTQIDFLEPFRNIKKGNENRSLIVH